MARTKVRDVITRAGRTARARTILRTSLRTLAKIKGKQTDLDTLANVILVVNDLRHADMLLAIDTKRDKRRKKSS